MEIDSQIDKIHKKIVCGIAIRKIKNSWIVFFRVKFFITDVVLRR